MLRPLGHVVALRPPPPMPPLADHVPHVLGVRRQEQMIGIRTGRIVAPVADEQARRDGANVNLPGEARRLRAHAAPLRPLTSVAPPIGGAGPCPAGIGVLPPDGVAPEQRSWRLLPAAQRAEPPGPGLSQVGWRDEERGSTRLTDPWHCHPLAALICAHGGAESSSAPDQPRRANGKRGAALLAAAVDSLAPRCARTGGRAMAGNGPAQARVLRRERRATLETGTLYAHQKSPLLVSGPRMLQASRGRFVSEL